MFVKKYKSFKYKALFFRRVGLFGVLMDWAGYGMEHALFIKTVSTKAGRQWGYSLRFIHE